MDKDILFMTLFSAKENENACVLASDGIMISSLREQPNHKINLNKEVCVQIDFNLEKCETNSTLNLSSHFLQNNKLEVRGKGKHGIIDKISQGKGGKIPVNNIP